MPRTPVLAHKVELARMSHVEVGLARREAQGVAVIPIGATEQHGPHLPMDVDTISTEYVVLKAAREVGVVVAPTIAYGSSRQNMGFAGTIALRPQTLIAMVKDICHSFYHHGFDKVLVANGHGGNVEPVMIALEEFHYETGALAALVKCWQLATLLSPEGAPAYEGHAGRQETELMLALRPEDVDVEAYVAAAPTSKLGELGSVAPAQYNPMDSPVRFAISAWESSPHGHYGDPAMATAERGQQVLRAWATNLAQLLRDVKEGKIKATTRTDTMPQH